MNHGVFPEKKVQKHKRIWFTCGNNFSPGVSFGRGVFAKVFSDFVGLFFGKKRFLHRFSRKEGAQGKDNGAT